MCVCVCVCMCVCVCVCVRVCVCVYVRVRVGGGRLERGGWECGMEGVCTVDSLTCPWCDCETGLTLGSATEQCLLRWVTKSVYNYMEDWSLLGNEVYITTWKTGLYWVTKSV